MKTHIEQLRERIEQNYREYKAEMLEVLDGELIFDYAREIAAVEDVYFLMTTYPSTFVDEGEAAYLLEFAEPLKMLADAWEEYLDESDGDFKMIVEDVLDKNDNTENYMTVSLANELREKYGADVHIKDALLSEAVEAGKRYLRLKNMLDDEGVGI